MPDIIFHHYQTSPFSEKVRLIFGYKKLAWKSVIIPPIMPKPMLTALNSPPAENGNSLFIDVHDVALGERVVIMPTDYALDPVEGELVLSTATELAVRRTDPQAGSLVVHFPRLGFQLKKL